jgi:hypothetical protein
MVKAGITSAEIIKKTGFKTSTQLKAAYMSALIAEGKVPAIKGSGALERPPSSKRLALGNVVASSSRKSWLKVWELVPKTNSQCGKPRRG